MPRFELAPVGVRLDLGHGGDNDSTTPLTVLTGYDGGLVTDQVLLWCAIAYLTTLPVLTIWTLAAQICEAPPQ